MVDVLIFTVGMGTIFFYLFENKHQALSFLDFLNIQQPNCNFNTEKEHMKQLPFLDVKVLIQTDYQNYNSFVTFTYKKVLIKDLIDRTYCLNITGMVFTYTLKNLRSFKKKTNAILN